MAVGENRKIISFVEKPADPPAMPGRADTALLPARAADAPRCCVRCRFQPCGVETRLVHRADREHRHVGAGGAEGIELRAAVGRAAEHAHFVDPLAVRDTEPYRLWICLIASAS